MQVGLDWTTIKEAVMSDIQKNFLLYTTEYNLQHFTSSAVTFATADNSISATGIGTAFPTTGHTLTVTGASESANNTTFTISTVSSANKVIVTETVTAEAAGATVNINEGIISDWLLSHHHHILAVNYYASQACTIYIDQGYNASSTDYTTTIPVLAATTMPPWEIDTTSKYFRFRVINGGVDQTDVRIFVNGKNY